MPKTTKNSKFYSSNTFRNDGVTGNLRGSHNFGTTGNDALNSVQASSKGYQNLQLTQPGKRGQQMGRVEHGNKKLKQNFSVPQK